MVERSAGVEGAEWDGDTWTVQVGGGRSFSAPVLVDAAGAWADAVAELAGVLPIGLMPLRRTAFLVDAPQFQRDDIPMTVDIGERMYFKQDEGQFLCSPADETLQPPSDPRPDETEMARAIDEINRWTSLGIDRIHASWAGLRTFAPDRSPVVGFDPRVPGFFWFAGQGGFGIKTSPALARAGAALVRGEALPPDIRATGITQELLGPSRFAG